MPQADFVRPVAWTLVRQPYLLAKRPWPNDLAIFLREPLGLTIDEFEHCFGRPAQPRPPGRDDDRSVHQDGMIEHCIEDLVIRRGRVEQPEFGGRRSLLAQDGSRTFLHGREQLFQLTPCPAGLEIVDHNRLVSGRSDQAKRVAGRAACRVVIDSDREVGHAGRSSLKSQPHRAAADAAPAIWATMKAGAEDGAIPANVSLSDRATVTAGFANEVEAVNQ